MVLLFGAVRPAPASLSAFAHFRREASLYNSVILFPRRGFSPLKRILQACFQSNSANGDTRAKVPTEQSEIIFLGTGTSEGIPRVSCLTNPVKNCAVCSKAVIHGNKNRRLNTSILIRYPNSSGRCNILVDAGKFFYHSALQWFPTFG